MRHESGKESMLWPIFVLLGFVACAVAPVAGAADEPWSEEQELLEIQRMIAEKGWSWTAGHTEVSHLTPEEKQAMLGCRPMDEETRRARANGELAALPDRDLPASWDWRLLGGTTPAKQQGSCGSCWAFAATGAFESMIKIYKGIETNLSEQQILVCNEWGGSCDGGQSEAAYFVQMSMGAVAETSMPYTANDGAPCVDDNYDSVEHHQGYTMVANIAANLKTAIMTCPIAVNMYAPGSLFYYNGGCFEYDGTGAINHCVLMCGWDDGACDGQGAWLIKNSWGTGWGENGFGWIRYGDLYLGQGANLIDYTPSYDVVLGYDGAEVIGGNGNGVLDPGETATLRVTLRNFGRQAGTGIAATLSCLDPRLTIHDPSADFPNIGIWSSASSLTPDFGVTASVAAEGPIQMTLTISCAEEDDRISTFPLFIGPIVTVYQEGFEAGTGGWTGGGTQNDWRAAAACQKFGKPDPYRAGVGLSCIGNDLNEAGGTWNILYAIDADNYLQSPIINCAGKEGVHLAFRRWLTVEEGLYDNAFLSVNGTELFRNPTNGVFFDEAWEEIVYDISGIADNNAVVRVQFDLESDAGLQYGGWAIDNVRLFVPGPPAAGIPDAGEAPLALSLRPMANPFRPGDALQLAIPAPGGRSEVRIIDAAGRSVRSLETGVLAPGVHAIQWDGRDDAGHALPAGIYFIRVLFEQGDTSSRLVLVTR